MNACKHARTRQQDTLRIKTCSRRRNAAKSHCLTLPVMIHALRGIQHELARQRTPPCSSPEP